MIIVLAVIGFIFYKRWSKVQITVTNKRVYGCDATAKRVAAQYKYYTLFSS